MKLPIEMPEVIEYCCNICGETNRLENSQFHRELAHCRNCGSNARFRGIINVLRNLMVVTDGLPLKDWPSQANIVGLGMSDWTGYADLLEKNSAIRTRFMDALRCWISSILLWRNWV